MVTPEAQQYLEKGSPEAQVHAAVPPGGIPLAELQKQLGGQLASVGFAQAKMRKWLDIDKSQGAPLVVRKVALPSTHSFTCMRQWIVPRSSVGSVAKINTRC